MSNRTLILPDNYETSLWPFVWPVKDPGDMNMDFGLDVGPWLLDLQDNLSEISAGWAPADGSLILRSISAQSSIVTVLVDGGIPWTNYAVTFVLTSQIRARVLSRTVLLPVQPLFSQDISALAASGAVSATVG